VPSFNRTLKCQITPPDAEQALTLSLALIRYGLESYRQGYEASCFDPKAAIAGSVVAIQDILTALGYDSAQEEVMKQCIGTQLLLALPDNTMH
jgi:hypothetical protein